MKMENCLLTLVLGLLMLGGSLARVVTVSPGPLIRVEGQPVSIRCDVNDYGGPREQDFEWMMSRDANAARIKIISTFDASYSHPSLSKRVASGDISVVRLEDNEVELKIAEVKAQDAGFYWCQTPSTDSVISGNYEAQVQLTVIPNTLKVIPQAPPPVVPEGSDFTLSCNVTRKLTHPTYLSVTWSVKKGATSEDILTFGPQGDAVAGPKFARRYADGGIRLVPGKNGLFELVISRVTSSDEGIYECNGTEWTHENGGKWTKIVESTKEMGTVSVTPTDAQNGCDIFAAVGSDVIVELKYALKNTQQLQWKRGDSTIYRHNPIKVITGNKGDVDDKGSLRLTKVDKTKEGVYRAEVHEDGKSQHTQSTKLCTVDAVPQPTVKIECLKTPAVKFTCNVKQAKDVEYKWIHNNEVMEQEKGATLTLTEGDEKWKDSQTDTFSCNVSNSVSTKSSAAVKQTCFRPKPLLPEKLWGINTWIIIGIGGGVVVLLIIIVIICCCQNRRKKRLRLKDEEELRLGWTNPNQQQHHHHHQHNHPPDHHHRHHHQQQPAGHTGPRQHRTKQHRSQQQQQQQQQPQQRPRAPDVPNGHPQPSPRRPAQAPRPAGNTDDEQPPPLPQPRKKAPKTPRE